MTIAKLFTHGGSQAVRLPKEFRFEGREVHVRRMGADVVLSPQAPASIRALIGALDQFEPGIRIDREVPVADERAAIRPRKR